MRLEALQYLRMMEEQTEYEEEEFQKLNDQLNEGQRDPGIWKQLENYREANWGRNVDKKVVRLSK
ncbi:hypothetical protein HPP92_016050 [Vanilla planifolia]|uniref:GTD-binding domain-containing protein n=1 Tax=Vanilla planifolia TaxID=51239 RepID=A0A835UQ45_VANPL|nr:hypothetical protein HPP92_016659 [Vanilla planifolia]KAG0471504.1 hypothetical protein HPP92_016050 [Vanilla planifolia]